VLAEFQVAAWAARRGGIIVLLFQAGAQCSPIATDGGAGRWCNENAPENSGVAGQYCSSVKMANTERPQSGGSWICPLNELGRSELCTMPKSKPATGPMRTQPIERASIMPTQVLPMMPTTGKKMKTGSQPNQKLTRAEAVRVAKAKITRRNSLRKQREALRG
jgi:hypothetical protein